VIVVDATVLAHLLLGGAHTPHARALYRRDAEWVAPRVWRTAFRELLTVYHTRGELPLADALQLADEAERLMRGADYEVSLAQVLTLAERSGRCAMDCEHAALARELGVAYVTADRELATALAPDAVWLAEVAAGE
jgi:predicted nucleic acid-binding protein